MSRSLKLTGHGDDFGLDYPFASQAFSPLGKSRERPDVRPRPEKSVVLKKPGDEFAPAAGADFVQVPFELSFRHDRLAGLVSLGQPLHDGAFDWLEECGV